MPISIIVHLPTGRRLREHAGAQSVAVQNAATEAYVELAEFDAIPSETTHRWNPALRTYEAYAALISRSIISREEFLDQWTDAELIGLHQLRIDPAGPVLQRARLEAIRDRITSRPTVNLTKPKVQTAVAWMVQQLANAGVITDTAPARQARITAILTPLTTEDQP